MRRSLRPRSAGPVRGAAIALASIALAALRATADPPPSEIHADIEVFDPPPFELTNVNGTLFFTAAEGVDGVEL